MKTYLYSLLPARGLFLMLISASIFLLALSCAPKGGLTTQTRQTRSEIKEEPEQAPVEAWEAEWSKTLNAAKKEGSIVVYTSSTGPTLKDATNIFKQKYGIALEIISGRGNEVTLKLLMERVNGLFIVDAFMVGMNSNMDVKPAGGLAPMESTFILPEVKDPKAWFGGKYPWGDKEHMLFKSLAYPSSQVGINTDMVKYDEIKSFYDILAPKWKSKIVMNDPTLAGTGFNGFASMIYNKALELDFFRQLVLTQPVMIEDQRLQVDWLAKAKYSIALWPQSTSMVEFVKAGAPVAFLPPGKEGTYLSTGGGVLSLVNKAPHPNAAKVFINWSLSREGQLFIQKGMQQQSARVDISSEGIDPLSVRAPGAKYFASANTVEEWILTEQRNYEKLAKETFGSLAK